MFKELLPLLEGRTMILTAAKIGDALTVTIYPKRNGEKDENPVGNTPLCVTGTAEELDHELPGLIAGYAEELGKFHNNLGQIKQQLADAASAVAEAAKVRSARKPATAPAKLAAKSAEPAEPPAVRPDLFTASMPAAAAPEPEPALADAADGTAGIGTDPGVVQPPAPSAAATQPRRRATPIRGKAVETPPVPGTAAAPISAPAGDPIGMASEEDSFEPEPAATAKPTESVQTAAQEMGWGDEDETTPVEAAVDDAGDDDDSCPF
jgi:PRTRC genetic system protein E